MSDNLVFSVRLGKRLLEYRTNPQHVQAAKMLVEQGINVNIGDTIQYVVTKDGVKPLRVVSRRGSLNGKT